MEFRHGFSIVQPFSTPFRPVTPFSSRPLCPLNISLTRFNSAIHLEANHPSFETQWPSFLLPMNREIQGMNFEKRRLRYLVTGLRALLRISLQLLNNIWNRQRYLFPSWSTTNWEFCTLRCTMVGLFDFKLKAWTRNCAKTDGGLESMKQCSCENLFFFSFFLWRTCLKWTWFRGSHRKALISQVMQRYLRVQLNKIYLRTQMWRYKHPKHFCSMRGMSINCTCRVSVNITADEFVHREHG